MRAWEVADTHSCYILAPYHPINIIWMVSYLTPVSDLYLAPPTEQFVASPPVRYINPVCCVKILNLTMMAIFVRWKILVCTSGHLTKLMCPGVVKICSRGGGAARNSRTRAPTKTRLLTRTVAKSSGRRYIKQKSTIWGPKSEFHCTHPRTNWDHNNALPWGVSMGAYWGILSGYL